MSGLDDAMAGLRAVAGAGMARAPSAPRSLTSNALALRDHARAMWARGRLDTFDIAKEPGVHESVVCGLLVRPGELRTQNTEARA